MEIAFVYDAVYPYVRGGAERRYHELGTRLAARGHCVRYVGWQYWDGPSTQRNADGTWLHGVGRPRALHDRNGRRTFAEAFAFAARSIPAVLKLNGALIDCSSIPYAPAIALNALARRRGQRLAVSWHEYMGDRWTEYAGRRATVARAVERRTASCGDLRIAVSEFTRDRLPAGPATVVAPNGIDLGRIDSVQASGGKCDVIVIGRLVPHKRVDLLLRALSLAPELTATIVGDGPDRERLERLAVELNVSERATFTGTVDSDDGVTAMIKSAGCLLLASEQEGFGMTVVEAMAAGTPPIVVEAPANGAVRLVTHGRDGLVAGNDVGEVAKAIRSVARDAARRKQLAEHALAAARRYDWDALTDALLGHYTRLATPAEATDGMTELRAA